MRVYMRMRGRLVVVYHLTKKMLKKLYILYIKIFLKNFFNCENVYILFYAFLYV